MAGYNALNHMSSNLIYSYSHNTVNFTAPTGLVTQLADPWRILPVLTHFRQNVFASYMTTLFIQLQS